MKSVKLGYEIQRCLNNVIPQKVLTQQNPDRSEAFPGGCSRGSRQRLGRTGFPGGESRGGAKSTRTRPAAGQRSRFGGSNPRNARTRTTRRGHINISFSKCVRVIKYACVVNVLRALALPLTITRRRHRVLPYFHAIYLLRFTQTSKVREWQFA